MAGESRWYRPAELERFSIALLTAAGAPEDIAALVSRHLVGANLAGHDSHGVLRLPSYVELIDQERLRPAARPALLRETATTAVVDGAHAFGYTTMQFACTLAATKAHSAGLAAVAMRRCGHIGRVGGWVEELAGQGLIAQVCVGSLGPNSGGVTPFGGAARVLGTNAWAIGVPAAGGPPVVLDFATSSVAEGKLRVARARRQPLPAGWIVGPDGQPSNDVEDFYRGGMLLPFGGHKGYALSVLAALFGGLAGDGTPGRINGVFLLALDPGAFGDAAAYTQTVAAALETLRATPAAPGSIGVQAPGEPERASRRLREQAIPLPPGTISELDAVAKRFGLTPPQALTEHRLLGEFLAHDYGLAPSQVLAALDRQQAASGERRRLGELLLELGWLDPARLEQALARQRADDEARR